MSRALYADNTQIGPQLIRTVVVFGLLAGSAFIVVNSITSAGLARVMARESSASPRRDKRWLPPAPRIIQLAPASQQSDADIALDSDDDPTQAAITWARRLPDDVLERDLAMLEGGDRFLKFGPIRISRRLVETVVRAARKVGVEPSTLMAIADKESSFRTSVSAQTSSATGLFQFIEQTWFKVVRDFGARHGLAREAAEIEGPPDRLTVADPKERERILGLRNQPYLSALLAAEMLKRDTDKIAGSLGRDLTVGETYLTHFLGPKDASKFLETLQDQPKLAADKLLRRPARANRPIFYAKRRALSVDAVHEKIEEMMGLRADRYATVGRISPNVTAYAE